MAYSVGAVTARALRGSRLALCAAVLALGVAPAAGPAVAADAAPFTLRGPDGRVTPDFGGFWVLDRSVSFRPRPPRPGPQGLPRDWMAFGGYRTNGNEPPPLRPEVFEEIKKRQVIELAGEDKDERTVKCQAPLVFDMYTFGETMDILQRHDELVMIPSKERALPRHVYIGRQHPPADEMPITINGDAVAHWEGNELVVDTIGFNDQTWLFLGDYIPHSDELHVVERFSLSPDGQTISVQMRIEDPKTFTKPWVLNIKFARTKDLPVEEACDIDNRGFEPRKG